MGGGRPDDPGTREHVINHGKRLVRLLAGGILVVLGLALSLPGVPGPGIAVVILGLSILSTDFEFARRLMTQLKGLARRAVRGGSGGTTVL